MGFESHLCKQITINVKDNVPGTNVQGAMINYFAQTKQQMQAVMQFSIGVAVVEAYR